MKKDQVKYKISPKGKRKLDFPKKSKPAVKLPLTGKTLYLDVKEVKTIRRLETDLKKLGGTIEEFLSKDINYLITCQPRPKTRRDPEDLSPTPSPFNCDPSPSPGSVDEKRLSATTRGRAIAEKARIHTKTTSTVIENAEKWGVKIVTVDGAFKWIERELKKLPKSPQNNKSNSAKTTTCVSQYKTFKAPFLKIESESLCYRPCSSQLEAWPRLNVNTPRGSCPFDGTLIAQEDGSREERGDLLAAQVDISTPDTPQEEKDEIVSGARTRTKSVDKPTKKSESDVFGSSRLLTAGELKRQKEQKRRQERKRGYCECCHVKYEDLDKHCRDDQHREYVRDKSHFEHLDKLIKSAPSPATFLQKEKMKSLQVMPKQPKADSKEDEDEVILIPVTPKQKNSKDLTRDTKLAPLSPCVKGKSPKDKSKNTNMDLRKMTPNGKNFLRIVKNPKQIKVSCLQREMGRKEMSPVKDIKDISPRTRHCTVNASSLNAGSKKSPEMITGKKQDTSSKSKSRSLFPALDQTNIGAEKRDSQNAIAAVTKIHSGSCTEASGKVEQTQKVVKIVVSPGKLGNNQDVTKSEKSPSKSLQKLRSFPRSPQKSIQNTTITECISRSFTKSPHKSLQNHTVTKSAVSSTKSPLKTKVLAVVEKSNMPSRQSPRKSVQNQTVAKSSFSFTKSPAKTNDQIFEKSSIISRKSPHKSVQNQKIAESSVSLTKLHTMPSGKSHRSEQKQKFKESPLKSLSKSNCSSPAKQSKGKSKVLKNINYDEKVKKDNENIEYSFKAETVETSVSKNLKTGARNRTQRELCGSINAVDKDFEVTCSTEEISDHLRMERFILDGYDGSKESWVGTEKSSAELEIYTDSDTETTVEQHESKGNALSKTKNRISSNQDHQAFDETSKSLDNKVMDDKDINTEADKGEKGYRMTAMDKENTLNDSENDLKMCDTTSSLQNSLDIGMDRNRHEKVSDSCVIENGDINKELGFDTLIQLGRNKNERPTSSDDFEKCIISAISRGDLMHKKVPENIEPDRVLRSKKSLDLQDVAKTDNQFLDTSSSLNQVTNSLNITNTEKTLQVKLQKSVDGPTNAQEKNLHETERKQSSDLMRIQKALDKPGNSEEITEFELPVDLQEEVMFTPTLAERVKARVRRNSVCSNNPSSPMRSRSNSVCSNQSDTSTGRRAKTVVAKVLLNKVTDLLLQNFGTDCNSQNSDKASGSNTCNKSDSDSLLAVNNKRISQKESKVDGNNRVNRTAYSIGDVENNTHSTLKTFRHGIRVKKVSSELEALKDTWNDLAQLDKERPSRSRSKSRQAESNSNISYRNSLIDTHENVDTHENDKLQLTDTQISNSSNCDINIKGIQKINKYSKAHEGMRKKVLIHVVEEQSQDISSSYENKQDTIDLSGTDNTCDDCLKIEENEDGRVSPVFNVSPIAKRRKTKTLELNGKENKKGCQDETNPLSEPSALADEVKSHSDTSKDQTFGVKKNSQSQRKVRISRAIRDSFTENSPPASNMDKVVISQCQNTPTKASSACDLSESADDSVDLNESCNKEKLSKQSTPDCKRTVPSSCPYGSGYSSTPRSERRKAWKRKNTARTETCQNSDNCNQSKKRRKLDKLKFVIADDAEVVIDNALGQKTDPNCVQNQTNSPRKCTKTRLVLEGKDLSMEDKTNDQKHLSNAQTNTKHGKKVESIAKGDKLLKNETGPKVHDSKSESAENFLLKWKSAGEDRNKVKLDKSWSLLSSRSVTKLLSSEDGRESFDGFTEEDINTTASLASDLSYVECWEVDKSINSEREFEVDIEPAEPVDVNKVEFDKFLPTFSSPGKKSDSSWFDACEDYMDKSVKNTIEPVSIYMGWTSPRKKSQEDKVTEEIHMSPRKSPGTPRRKKEGECLDSGKAFKRVDMEIQFNFRSPQKDKNRQVFSPLKEKRGRVVDTSSPHCKTSTPSRRTRYSKDT